MGLGSRETPRGGRGEEGRWNREGDRTEERLRREGAGQGEQGTGNRRKPPAGTDPAGRKAGAEGGPSPPCHSSPYLLHSAPVCRPELVPLSLPSPLSPASSLSGPVPSLTLSLLHSACLTAGTASAFLGWGVSGNPAGRSPGAGLGLSGGAARYLDHTGLPAPCSPSLRFQVLSLCFLNIPQSCPCSPVSLTAQG